MPAILGFFLIIIVIVLVVGFSIISGVLKFLFGIGRKRNYGQRANSGQSTPPSGNSVDDEPSDRSRKKIFDKDEGEYVDFEELDGKK